MREKAAVPAIIVGVVLVIVVVYFLGRTFLAPSPTNTGKIVYPSFIDPSTGKPWANGNHSGSSGQGTPGGNAGSPNAGSPNAGGMTGSPNTGGSPGGQ